MPANWKEGEDVLIGANVSLRRATWPLAHAHILLNVCVVCPAVNAAVGLARIRRNGTRARVRIEGSIILLQTFVGVCPYECHLHT